MTNALNTPISLLTVPVLLFVVSVVAFVALGLAMLLEVFAGCSRSDSALVISVIGLFGSVLLYHLAR